MRRLAVLSATLLLLACPPPRMACPDPLVESIRPDVIEGHLRALADIAAANGGTRAAGTPGYQASADYVAETLAAAGLRVERQLFRYPDYELLGPAVFEQAAPEPATYEFGADFRVAPFSGDGDVQGPVIAVDLALGTGNASSSGCEPEDFAGFFPNSVALIQRGTCYHYQKIANAVAAGASAVVLFNQGDSEAHAGVYAPRLAEGTPIPVVAVSYAFGEALAGEAAGGLVLRVGVEGQEVQRETENVIAELPGLAGEDVIMLGAHLDSVPAGPGINDNGSGVATVLEVMAGMRYCSPFHQVRAGFWGAEELGLIGSTHYVESLAEAERARLTMYLNFDMIASPNPVRLVYDGDGSAFDKAGPPGSDAIEAAFADDFAGHGLASAETAFDGRSDYWAFIRRGIPSGGLFTGAEEIKSKDEAKIFGGEANEAYDPCYHQACDDVDNYDRDVLRENARTIAEVVERFAAAVPALR